MGKHYLTIWTDERDAALRTMVGNQISTRSIAAALGLHQTQIVRRIKVLKLKEAPPPKSTAPDHIVKYQRVRRGFHVPPHLEAEYHQLLKSGVSIAEICRRLNIKTNPA